MLQAPPFTENTLLPNQPEPVVVGGQTYLPEPVLSGLQLQTNYYYYDLPTTPSENPNPTFRPDQVVAYLQQASLDMYRAALSLLLSASTSAHCVSVLSS